MFWTVYAVYRLHLYKKDAVDFAYTLGKFFSSLVPALLVCFFFYTDSFFDIVFDFSF